MSTPSATYSLDYAHKRAIEAVTFAETEGVGYESLRRWINNLYFSGLALEKPLGTPSEVKERSVLILKNENTKVTVDIPKHAQEDYPVNVEQQEYPRCVFGSDHCMKTPCSECPTFQSSNQLQEKKPAGWQNGAYSRYAYMDTDSFPLPFYESNGEQFLRNSIPGHPDHSNTIPYRPIDGITGFWLLDHHFTIDMRNYPAAEGDYFVAALMAIPYEFFNLDEFCSNAKRFYYQVNYFGDGTIQTGSLLYPMEWLANAQVHKYALENPRRTYKFVGKHSD